MKTLKLILILLFFGQLTTAQKNFEGKVVYNVEGRHSRYLLEAFFKNQKIRVIYNDPGSNNHERNLLVDLSTGLIHEIYPQINRFQTDSICKSKHLYDLYEIIPPLQKNPKKNKIILGNQCTAYSGIDTTRGDFLGPLHITIWFADSLHFSFDKKYSGYPPTLFLGNGYSIGTALEITTRTEKKSEKVFTSVARIEEKILADSLFVVPLKYKLINYETLIDTAFEDIEKTIMREDSIAAVIMKSTNSASIVIDGTGSEKNKEQYLFKQKNSKPKRSPSKNTHTLPTKSTPTKPKD